MSQPMSADEARLGNFSANPSGITLSGSPADLLRGDGTTAANPLDRLTRTIGAVFTAFVLRLHTDGASVIQHAIFGTTAGGAPANGFCDAISGHTAPSSSLANTPSIAAGVDFVNSVGIATNTVYLDSGQNDAFLQVHRIANSSGTDFDVLIAMSTGINVNGSNRPRLQLTFRNRTTGATIPIATILNAPNLDINLSIQGWACAT